MVYSAAAVYKRGEREKQKKKEKKRSEQAVSVESTHSHKRPRKKWSQRPKSAIQALGIRTMTESKMIPEMAIWRSSFVDFLDFHYGGTDLCCGLEWERMQ
jgi:hypothetical protein